MKTYLWCAVVFVISSSFGGPVERDPITDYVPVMMHRDQLESAVKTETARPLSKVGKIYKAGNYLFVNEQLEGIHIFNNSNTLQPVPLGFLRIPGAVDMAYKDGYLYVDNAVDLVTFDVKNAADVRLVSRIKNAFPETLPPDLGRIPIAYSKEKRPEGLIIIGWELKK
jgi:hypothetical protein